MEGGFSRRGHQERLGCPREEPEGPACLPCPTPPPDGGGGVTLSVVNRASARFALSFLSVRAQGCLSSCVIGMKRFTSLQTGSLDPLLGAAGACLSCSVFTTWYQKGGIWCHAAFTAHGCVPGLSAHKKHDSTCSREHLGHVPHRLTDKWLEASRDRALLSEPADSFLANPRPGRLKRNPSTPCREQAPLPVSFPSTGYWLPVSSGLEWAAWSSKLGLSPKREF